MPLFLNTADASFADDFERLLNLKREVEVDVDHVAADIIADVRARGLPFPLRLLHAAAVL